MKPRCYCSARKLSNVLSSEKQLSFKSAVIRSKRSSDVECISHSRKVSHLKFKITFGSERTSIS